MKHLTPEQEQIVRKILKTTVPKARVAVFGSRATGIRKKIYSDLDLLIEAPRPLSLTRTRIIKEAFSDSRLPFRVDIVDAKSISKKFLDQIQADLIVIQT